MLPARVRQGLLSICAFVVLLNVRALLANISTNLYPLRRPLLQSIPYESMLSKFLNESTVTVIIGLFSVACGVWIGMPWEERSRTLQKWFQSDTSITDPPLLKEYSTCRSFTIGGPKPITYSSVRTFYRPHPQADKLPSEPTALPLLVFIHGLGGSLSQFATLMTSLTKVAPCLGIDLPGCGLSKFAPRAWEAYTTEALVRLVATVIQEHREASKKQGIVLLGHSMGCSMGALLASSKSEFSDATSKYALGLIAICPQASPPDEKKTRRFKQLLGIPGPIFELWRLWDKRGGTESASVARHVGPGADIETKKMQVKFNAQSRTPVFRRVAQGSLPDYSSDTAVGGLPGADVWAGLEVPVLLIGGEADKVTPAEEL